MKSKFVVAVAILIVMAGLVLGAMQINAAVTGLAGICIGPKDVAYVWSTYILEDYVAVNSPIELPQIQFKITTPEEKNQIGLHYELQFLKFNYIRFYWTAENFLSKPNLEIDLYK